MANASINLTIDLAAFRSSLTAAFGMVNDLAKKAGTPIKLDADTGDAKSKINELSGVIEETGKKSDSFWVRNRAGFASLSLVYNGVMAVYNDVVRVFGSFINEATEAEKATARVTAAVRSTGGAAGYTAEQLKGIAGGLEAALSIDADDLMSQVTTPLLTFKAVTGDVFEEAQVQVLNMSRALGVDLQGAAMQVGKALQDPVEGLTALRRSGVSFSDAQQDVIQALYNTGQAAEAQRLILAELASEFGGQAEAYAGTRAGQIEALKISFNNLKEAIGNGLLPVIAGLGSVVGPVFDLMGGLIGKLTGQKSALDNAKTAIIGQRVEFEKLVLIYTDLHLVQNKSREQQEQYGRTINELMTKYPNYLGKVDLERGKWSEISTAIMNARSQLQAYINLKIQEAVVKDMETQIVALSTKIVNAESQLYGLKAEFAAGTKSALKTVNTVADPLKGQTYGGTAQVISKWGQEEMRLEGKIRDLTAEQEKLNAVLRQRLEIAQQIYAVPPAPAPKPVGNAGVSSVGSGGGGSSNGAADIAASEAETKLRDAEAMMAELARLRKTETEQMLAEYEKRKAIILAYTADESEAEKTALADLDAWKTQKEGEITAREKAGTQEKFRAEVDYLSNLQEMGVSSYDQLKAKMEEYYAWAQANLPADEAALVQKQLQESNLRWGAAQKEKEEKERDHQRTLADIRAEWNGRNLSLEEQDLNAQLEALRRKYEDEKALMIEAGMTEAQITEMYAKKKADIEQKYNDQIREDDERNILNAASGMSKMLGQIGGVMNKESKKGFNTWKAMAIAQGYVDTFSASIGAYRSMVGIPGVGPVLAAAAAAAAMVAGLANIANISNQKYEPPQAAEGGYLEGPGHDRGGVIINAEGGEYVINKKSTAKFRGVLDEINNDKNLTDLDRGLLSEIGDDTKMWKYFPWLHGNLMGIRAKNIGKRIMETGGFLQGEGHDRGGVVIEAEGGEYITRKSRVSELGKGIFDFINNGPIAGCGRSGWWGIIFFCKRRKRAWIECGDVFAGLIG